MYTKALDLLLGSNQALLGSSIQKRGLASQLHRNTKSSFNFKLKTPSHGTNGGNEKSSELRPDSARKYQSKIASTKLASDRIYLQTERELKKVGTTGNFDIQKKDFVQVPLSDRDLPKDYAYKSKDFIKADTKGMIKAVVPIPGEAENPKSGIIGFTDQKKAGYHKYTKSEGRLKKPDNNEKIEVYNSTKMLMNGNSRTKQTANSPKRQSYIYNHNNIVNVFLNSNQEKKYDKTMALKSERQQQQEAQLNSDSDSMTRMFKSSRSPNSDVLAKFNQSLPKKLTSQDFEYKNLDFSPVKVSHKESGSSKHPRGNSRFL